MAETKTTKSAALDMEALKAQLLEELKAEMKEEQTAKTQAKTEEQKNAEAWLNELVDVKLFKDGKQYNDDVFVAINGESVRIQRGKHVRIKRKFALALEQQERQDIEFANYSDKLHREFENDTRSYNI